jgi:asparagine synthase (glutamine-hydrolysing)
MGVWYVCRNDARAPERLKQATEQIRRHGHPEPRSLTTPHFVGLHAGHVHAGLPTFVQVGDDFVAIAGTLFYRGEAGEQAMKLLLADYAPPFDRWSDMLGHFAALIYKRGKLYVMTDWSASFHVYQSADKSVVSTSFLSTARSLDKLTFNTQAVYEFVFAETPMGDDTVFAEISRPSRTQELELGGEVRVHTSPRAITVDPSPESEDHLLERIASALRQAFAIPAKHYADNIQCPLSGGFDSRLVLSLLWDQGVKPSVYVYGGKNDEDVVVAKHIAAKEGFDLEVFEKGAFRQIEPDQFPEIAEMNFHEMDGTPITGGMFDAGGNSHARHNRARGGALAVSGAAGEIFRNYFYLADRPFASRAVVDAFYAMFDPADCTSEFDEGSYLERLDRKLQVALGVGQEKMSRLEVERAYPLFRCPAGFGREISMVGRFGAYFVPFCEHALTSQAANIPVRLRTHGLFQSRLLAHINRRVAAYPSAYGHAFTEMPSARHRLSEAVSLYRPPWLRRYSFRIKRRIERERESLPRLLTPPFLGKVIDLSFPAMSKFFNMNRLSDPRQYASVATLEYLANHFADRIKG